MFQGEFVFSGVVVVGDLGFRGFRFLFKVLGFWGLGL